MLLVEVVVLLKAVQVVLVDMVVEVQVVVLEIVHNLLLKVE